MNKMQHRYPPTTSPITLIKHRGIKEQSKFTSALENQSHQLPMVGLQNQQVRPYYLSFANHG